MDAPNVDVRQFFKDWGFQDETLAALCAVYGETQPRSVLEHLKALTLQSCVRDRQRLGRELHGYLTFLLADSPRRWVIAGALADSRRFIHVDAQTAAQRIGLGADIGAQLGSQLPEWFLPALVQLAHDVPADDNAGQEFAIQLAKHLGYWGFGAASAIDSRAHWLLQVLGDSYGAFAAQPLPEPSWILRFPDAQL